MGEHSDEAIDQILNDERDDEWAEYRRDGLHVGKYPRCQRCNTVCAWHKQWNCDLQRWDFHLVEKNNRATLHACPTAKPSDFPVVCSGCANDTDGDGNCALYE